jgi:hypothetical protein
MPITQNGTVKDKRGRTVTIIAANLPGKYPVIGIQYRKEKPDEISKGGTRRYTKNGGYYANGGRQGDYLDLDLSTFRASGAATPTPPSMVNLVYCNSNDEVVGGPISVAVGSEDYEDMIDNGWIKEEDEEDDEE